MKKRNSILTMTIAFAMAVPSAFALASLFEVKDVKQVHATGTVELSTLTGDYVAQDGDILTGTLGGNYKISVADGATVTLNNATITTHQGTGLTCDGTVTLMLSGENTIRTYTEGYPGIFVVEHKTLTIDGEGTLNVFGPEYYGPGIGSGYTTELSKCGNIVINSGTININQNEDSRSGGAGIGSGTGWHDDDYNPIPQSVGNITINGGVVKTKGGNNSAGIGGGYARFGSITCGNITITGGTVISEAGQTSGAGIGTGRSSSSLGNICGDIIFTGGDVTAISHKYGAAIGSGSKSQSSCGNIRIYDSVERVKAFIDLPQGSESDYGDTIGAGTDGATCGEITVGGVVTGPIRTNPYIYPLQHTHDWSYVADGASITASCSASDCPVTSGLTLTLEAPDNLVYDGTNKVCSFATGYSEAAFGTPSIEYYKDNSLITECVNAGTYEARVTVGGATAKVQFEITQATPTGYDIPTGLEAVYGDKLSSVTLPGHWSWKNPNDLVGNAGERTHAAIYTPEDPNYKAVEVNVTVTVAKANPTYVVPSTIDAPYDVELSTIGLPEGFSWMDGTQKTSTWGENTFKAKYTPTDTVNYNVVENIDIKVNVKWILVDPTEGDVSVTIKDGETEYNVDISVKVEVKTEVTIDEKRTEYASIGREFIKQDEDINAIYSVKLIRTVGGVQTEIQPSDIKEGTKIIVSMPVPEQLVSKPFRLLEIFNSSEAKEFSNNEYAITGDGKTLMVEVDRMGEFAFISHTDTDNGFIYTTGGGIPVVVVIFIVLGVIILSLGIAYVLMMFVFNKWIRKDDKALRAVMLGKKDNKVRLLVMPFRFEYRQEAEVFNTKQEALKE